MKGSTPRQAAGCLSLRHRQGTGYFHDRGAQVRRLPGNAGQPDSQAVYTITNLPKFRRTHPLSTNPDVFCQSLPVVTRGWLFRRYAVAYGCPASSILAGSHCLTEGCYRNLSAWDHLEPAPIPAPAFPALGGCVCGPSSPRIGRNHRRCENRSCPAG